MIMNNDRVKEEEGADWIQDQLIQGGVGRQRNNAAAMAIGGGGGAKENRGKTGISRKKEKKNP